MARLAALACSAVVLFSAADPGGPADIEPQQTAGPISVPAGSPPVIDGTIAAEEWRGARRELFKDGSELLLLRHGEDLYLGIRALGEGMIGANVFIESGEGISIHHVSAALGTAVYKKGDGGWRLVRDFSWRCRRTDSGQEATAERDAFFREEGWVASNSRMGAPQELECRIRPKSASFRLAAHYIRASEPAVKIPWPPDLDDDTVRPTPTGLPPELSFSPEKWAMIAPGQPASTAEADKEAVVQTALDYADGLYSGDAERKERALHPDLNKVAVSVQGGFPVLSGPYLGQKRPGLAPEIFAPGIVSLGFHEHNIAISPDGKEIFFVAAAADFSRYLIMTTKEENGAWTTPEVAPFSGGRNDGAPAFSPNGQRLYFSSRRPRPAGGAPGEDFDIWFVERRGGSWTDPVNLGSPVNTGQNEVNPSVSSDGTIYFQRIEKLGTLDWDLYRAPLTKGAYGPPEKLPTPVNTEANEAGPFIAPDGNYLLFQSNRPGGYGIMDIYVTFRTQDGGWSDPVSLGDKINSPYSDWGPVMSPDGKYLFFSSFRNVEPIAPGSPAYLDYLASRLGAPVPGKGTLYWMGAGIIDTLRPKKGHPGARFEHGQRAIRGVSSRIPTVRRKVFVPDGSQPHDGRRRGPSI